MNISATEQNSISVFQSKLDGKISKLQGEGKIKCTEVEAFTKTVNGKLVEVKAHTRCRKVSDKEQQSENKKAKPKKDDSSNNQTSNQKQEDAKSAKAGQKVPTQRQEEKPNNVENPESEELDRVERDFNFAVDDYEDASQATFNFAEDNQGFRDAIGEYTEGEFEAINKDMREGLTISDMIRFRVPHARNAALIHWGLSDAPRFDGTTFRGNDFSSRERRRQFLDKISGGVGSVFSDPAFLSTSTESSTADQFLDNAGNPTGYGGYFVTINSNQGVAISSISNYSEETEVLFNASTRFVIEEIEKTEDAVGAPIYNITLSDPD